MRRTVVSTPVTHPSGTPSDNARRSFAALLEFLDNVEGSVELTATSAHLSLSPLQLAIMREAVAAAVEGQDLLMQYVISGVPAGFDPEKVFGLIDLVPARVSLVGPPDDKSPASMSSQEVADVLNVSRPFVVKLARSGALPYTKVGNRHRFKASDVAAYAEGMRSDREAALREMVPEGGYTSDDF